MCFWLYYETNKACLFECGALVSCWHYNLETSYLYVALTGVHYLHNVISLCSLVWLLASKNCVIHGASSLFLMSYLFMRYLIISLLYRLWCCWWGGRKCIRPVKKTEWWGAGMVICLERGADLHMAQLMPLPLTVSCFSEIQIGFIFLLPAYPGSPGVCIFD